MNGGMHNSDAGEGSSSQMDTEFFQDAFSALPQTPPRRSPRLTPKKRVPYSPSPSRLSQGPQDLGAKGEVALCNDINRSLSIPQKYWLKSNIQLSS
jgi:hypothetical protein